MAFRYVSIVVMTAALGACATPEEPRPAASAPVQPAAPVVATTPASSPTALATLKPGTFRAGGGILESIGLITLPASAAAGGTVPPGPVPGPYRLTIRMDDGNVQTVQADTRALLVGDRVRITEDGRLIRP